MTSTNPFLSPSTLPYELRAFVRTAGPAHLIEVVDRGLLGLKRPRVRPAVRFEQYREGAEPQAAATWLT